MHRPLRIAFVIQNLAGLRGGAERVLINTARGLAARGHDVRILTYDGHAGPPAFDPAPVPVSSVFPLARHRAGGKAQPGPSLARRVLKALPDLPLLARAKWAASHGLFARRLHDALRQMQPQVVVAFLPPAIAAAGAAVQRLPGVAFVASTHSLPAADFDDGSPRWDQNPVYRARARSALRRADAVTILQPEFADWFAPDQRARLHVLPNAVTRLSPPQTPPPPRLPVILAVGRLGAAKGHPLLIAAFARIAARFPDWRVTICGEGAQRAALTAQIQALGLGGRIDLPGAVADIGPRYDRASILCHPSQLEGFGLVVAEAMLHGLPPVAFADCPGVNGLIRDGENGLLVIPGPDRVAALADALARLMESPDLRQTLATAAAQPSARLDPQAVLQQWDDLLQAVRAAGPQA